jgi:mxaK protein
MALISHRPTRHHTRLAWWLLGLCVLAAAVQLALLRRDQHTNATILAGVPATTTETPTNAQLAFAQACALAASGAEDAALKRFGALQSDAQLGHAARYNGANVLMRQALRLHAGPQPGQALALVELAKESYRQVLRDNPARWDARYNLERAQRLVPDPEDIDASAAPAPSQSERAATTMRGYSPGLP